MRTARKIFLKQIYFRKIWIFEMETIRNDIEKK